MSKQNKPKTLAAKCLEVRDQSTLDMARRTVNIMNCAPEGVFKLLHAITLSAFDGKPVKASTVDAKYSESVKASKNIQHNLGRLSSQPFPMITSKAETGLNTNKFREVPLYDISTGTNTALRYSNVALSDLGRLLTRHYKDEPMDFSDHYKSIVPFALLRKSDPWTMGHRSTTYPLNPKELFQLQIKMMEKNSPIVDDKDLEEIFRGFDVGENYKVYMTSSALRTLYTRGESSFIAVPKIEVNVETKQVIIKAPKLDSTTKVLRDHLNSKMLGPLQNRYKTFTYEPDVGLIGVGIRMNILSIADGVTVEDIIKELESDKMIYRKHYTRNESLVYLDEDQTGKINPHNLPVIQIDEEDGLTPEQMKELTEEEILEMVSKKNAIDLSESAVQQEFLGQLKEMDKFEIMIDATSGGDIENVNINPFPFEIDSKPIYEVLWQAIIWEKEQQKKTIQKQIDALKEQLKLDLLLEKVTRPEIAKVVYELQPNRNRINELLDRTKEGSELLPEGFRRWEVDLIYKESGNDYLAKIWLRDKYKDQYMATQLEIDRLNKLYNDDQAISDIIKSDLMGIISSPRYDRKSEVFFLLEDNPLEMDIIPQQDAWDEEDLPTTLFFNKTHIRRNYGVNIYFERFEPIWEINTTNLSKINMYLNTDGVLTSKILEVNTIPTNATIALPENCIGISPMTFGKPRQRQIIWTNRNRYLIHDGIIVEDNIELFEGEIIIGWQYMDKEEPFLDIRSEKGLGTIRHEELKQFKQLKPFPETFGYVYDLLVKKENDNIAKLWFKDKISNKSVTTDQMKFGRVMLKTKYAQLCPVDDRVASIYFSPKQNLYYDGYYLWNLRTFYFAQEHKEKPSKIPYLTESAYVNSTDEASLDHKDKLISLVNKRYQSEKKLLVNQLITIATYTEEYKKFNDDGTVESDAIRKNFNKEEIYK